MEPESCRKIQKSRASGEMNSDRKITVSFADPKLVKEFGRLKKEEPELYRFIDRALDDLKADPECGIPIPKSLIPKIYVKRYGVNNLWKYNLPNAWRLIYFLSGTKIEVIAVVLEWMKHDEYERRFKY